MVKVDSSSAASDLVGKLRDWVWCIAGHRAVQLQQMLFLKEPRTLALDSLDILGHES